MERSQRLQKAQDFIWCNARLIERYLFTLLFANGSREPVLAALRAYQNEDGGFGNALEPDKRCPPQSTAGHRDRPAYTGCHQRHG